LIDIAERLEGLSRHASTHAAGIVISPEPLTDFLPLYKAPNDEAIITQFDMGAIKRMGLLKFDFLGLKTLTVIDKAEKILNASPGPEGKKNPVPFSIERIPLDDKKTLKLLCSARTTGIFQLESPGMRDLLAKLKPEVFEDLIALVALYRPGPLGSGMVDEFIKGKTGKVSGSGFRQTGSLIKLNLPLLDEIIRETHGIILYQEQVMEIAHKLANFTLSQADILRKAMGGKNPDEMEKLKNTFIKGVKSNKISEKKAETLFNLILQFAQYGFNKSHSAAYAMIAYRTAYLKAHYPVEFMAAALSSDMDNTSKVVTYINECKEMGIEILPPDINESQREFSVIGKSIRFGLEAVKGVGSAAIDTIIESRKNEDFASFFDFCSKVDSRKVNKKVIESLIKAGALDSMGRRAQLTQVLGPVMDTAMKAQKERISGQRSMFESHQNTVSEMPEIEEWSESERLLMEKDALGFYITGHPLNKYKEKLKSFSVTNTLDILDLPDKQDLRVGGVPVTLKKIQTKRKGDLMAYLTIEDLFGTAELIVFPDVYRESANLISQETPLIISGHIDKSDKGLKIIAKKIISIEDDPGILEDTASGRDFKPRNGARPVSATQPAPLSNRSVSKKAQPRRSSTMIVTLNADTDADSLSGIKDILLRHAGSRNVPVYLKIISPHRWETTILTGQQVSPTEEMVLEVENVLGKGSVKIN
jgi:DNA polymerase-3 subunit alpha